MVVQDVDVELSSCVVTLPAICLTAGSVASAGPSYVDRAMRDAVVRDRTIRIHVCVVYVGRTVVVSSALRIRFVLIFSVQVTIQRFSVLR